MSGDSGQLRRGDRIPGSRFFRNYCRGCREPLRVDVSKRHAEDLYCEECDPPHRGVATPHGSPITSDERGRGGGYSR